MTAAPPGSLITPASAVRLTGMARVAPAADLADLVEQHWIVVWDHRDRAPVVQEVLPDPCVNLAVEPDGVLVHGVKSGTSRHVLAGRGIVVGTKFRPGGFSGFADGPVRALNDRVLPVERLLGRDGERLTEAVARASSPEDTLAIVTAFLRERRPPSDPQRLLVGAVVDAMRDAAPGTRVADVARRFGFSPRSLQRLFALHVGATPKAVLQRARHQRAVDRLETGRDGLARLAAELGCFDQAHFTRDFRAATGRLPGAAAGMR